jgi:hypothetical protein
MRRKEEVRINPGPRKISQPDATMDRSREENPAEKKEESQGDNPKRKEQEKQTSLVGGQTTDEANRRN